MHFAIYASPAFVRVLALLSGAAVTCGLVIAGHDPATALVVALAAALVLAGAGRTAAGEAR
ncbi:hypothetical protein [Nocardiopsis chromatogenes]|uniref:hypothetical protein n=1 Tax=Nocardiopsis chromatogenes TaxID=280239 RepID=UPI000364C673|nr:hypothetical protein [Nocardiopsis chromatogenes]